MSVENWRNILLSRNRAEETNGVESVAAKDEGWVDQEGDELPASRLRQDPEEEVDLENVADPQFDRACDMLRGILVFKKR